MPRTIQIRNVPDRVYRKLKKRAKDADMSLSAYVRQELRKSTEGLTIRELSARVRRREPVTKSISVAEIIREGREERERHLASVFDQNNPTPLK
jgi:plasmid stability protein